MRRLLYKRGKRTILKRISNLRAHWAFRILLSHYLRNKMWFLSQRVLQNQRFPNLRTEIHPRYLLNLINWLQLKGCKVIQNLPEALYQERSVPDNNRSLKLIANLKVRKPLCLRSALSREVQHLRLKKSSTLRFPNQLPRRLQPLWKVLVVPSYLKPHQMQIKIILSFLETIIMEVILPLRLKIVWQWLPLCLLSELIKQTPRLEEEQSLSYRMPLQHLMLRWPIR